MDKKKIISLLAAGVMMVGITVSLGTGAWFTDNKASNANAFKTGTLKLGEPGKITSGMSLDNIYPGWTESKTVTINNAGSLALKYKMSVSPLTGNILYDGKNPIQVNVNNKGFVNINALNEVFLGEIPANTNGTFDIAFMLPKEAGNDYVGKTTTFEFNFTAAQINDTSFRVNNSPTTVNVKTGNVDNAVSFNNIQNAINAVAPGGIVNVAAGIYVEQVIIDGKDITINGETNNGNKLVTIQSPALLSTLFTTSSAAKPIIAVKNTNNFNINNIIVDGNMQGQANYRFMGIGLYNAGGNIKNCEIKNIIEATYNGMQHGVGIYAYNTDGTARTLNVDKNVIYNYNKGGIVINGEKLTGNVTNNTVTGQGVPNINGQNGIQFGFGATGTVVGNTVTKNLYDTQTAAGILLYQAVNMKSVDQIKADNPYISGNDIDVFKEQ
jgi:predicted ribosomally synthesized peptide with SipW-like signal peptide